ncbi:uncharacterized protein LOC110449157 [Mizuhopecten yessoensis]|uniref:uncharacterized protein LOC110449157 n=1 Tax=Mizuhopecten yessoensis TaxID=6573 RepID=UPI000B45D268|nr:uncharacterized protein LOC110449157 [Mizuhopecten yessoensis]XP_021351506.1 uncharacterized protein LOC110449157 [Mizuhopecten yessoensis]XP_021351507.1 uncharacterized protein LOC110449157 [Mizuhopecten yessoensis]
MGGILHYPVSDHNKLPSDTSIKDKVKETDGLCGKKSDIWIKTAAGELVEAGFKIKQSESGFRIVELDLNNYIVSELQLTENDKLLAINNIAVSCREHHEVVEFLQQMFHPERSRLSIVIERKEWTDADKDTVTTFEIEVDYLISRGGGSAFALFTRTTILSRFSGFSAVYCIHHKGTDVCLIAIDTPISQLYLECGTDGKLTMSNLPSRTDTSFHFRKSIFHGFQKQHSENQSCFLCILQPVGTEKYVSVKNRSSVDLSNCPVGSEDITSMTSLQEADPRFFLLKLKNVREKNEYMFESVILKGMCLTWDNTKKEMKLKDSSDSSVPFSALNSTFHIYSL